MRADLSTHHQDSRLTVHLARISSAGPHDLSTGYSVQDQIWASGQVLLAGYKIGLTSANSQKTMGTSEPIAGRLAATAIRSSPAQIYVHAQHLRIIEAEVIFEIGDDFTPGAAPFTTRDAFDHTKACYAGIELCDTRIAHNPEPTLAEIVADNANADRLVIGDRLSVSHPEALDAMPVRLRRQRQTDIHGSTAHVLGNPLAALAWLANHLASRGEVLRAGLFVASGSCSGMTELAISETATAIFGEAGAASITLKPNQAALGEYI